MNTTSVHKSFPMAEIQKEVNIFFYFSKQLWLCPKNIFTQSNSLDVFRYNNDIFHISYFIDLFPLIVAVVEPVIHSYFGFVYLVGGSYSQFTYVMFCAIWYHL